MTLARKPVVHQKPLKPRIAEINEELAKENIAVKLGFLQRCLKISADVKHLAMVDHPGVLALTTQRVLPTSIRQFNAFCTQKLPVDAQDLAPPMIRNANDTLNRHRELRASVVDAIEAWKHHLKVRDGKASKSESLARMKKVLIFNQTVRRIAERELLAARERVESLSSELLRVQRAFEALKIQAAIEAEKHRELEMKLRNLEQDRTIASRVVTIR